MSSINPSSRPFFQGRPVPNNNSNNNQSNNNNATSQNNNNNNGTAQTASSQPSTNSNLPNADYTAAYLAAQQAAQLSAIPYENVKLDVSANKIQLRVGNGNDAIKMDFPNGITRDELTARLAQYTPGTPQSRFYPFEKALLRYFNNLDRNGDGQIGAKELTLLAGITGGSNNRTITATDFKTIIDLPPLKPFRFNASQRHVNGNVSITVQGEENPITLPGILTPENLDRLLQQTPTNSPNYAVLFELGQAMFKSGSDRVKVGGFLQSLLGNNSTDGIITPQILYAAS